MENLSTFIFLVGGLSLSFIFIYLGAKNFIDVFHHKK